MGIRFRCPHCQSKLHVKAFLAGKRGVCPDCQGKILIPTESEPGYWLSLSSAATQAQPNADLAAANPAEIEAEQVVATVPNSTASEPVPTFELGESGGREGLWYVRPPSGGEYGPASLELLQRWTAEGRVTADSLVWREGWPHWRPAADVWPATAGASAAIPAAPSADHPDLPVPEMAAPSIQTAALRYQRTKRNRQSRWTTAVVFLAVIAIGLVVALAIVVRRG